MSMREGKRESRSEGGREVSEAIVLSGEIDPRLEGVRNRLNEIRRIIVVLSGKGGVGKSLIASSFALILSSEWRVGLLDLDFEAPSDHVILGIGEDVSPKEDKGIIPPEIHGIKFMSMFFFTRRSAAAFRGIALRNAMIELLAITKWGSLDFLVVDMPPGVGEVLMEVINIMRGAKFLLVTTPAKSSIETVKRVVSILKSSNSHILGVVENMKRGKSGFEISTKLGVRFLGEIGFDDEIDERIGDVNMLKRSYFFARMKEITKRIVEVCVRNERNKNGTRSGRREDARAAKSHP